MGLLVIALVKVIKFINIADKQEHKSFADVTHSLLEYNYLTKKEIKAKMQRAVKLLHDKDNKLSCFSKYQLLLREDNFAKSLQAIKKKWGNPTEESTNSEYISGKNYDTFSCLYPQFYVSNIYDSNNYLVNYLETRTVSFGFAGVYIGVPECDKTYVEKLFKNVAFISKHEFYGKSLWSISIQKSTRTFLYIEFDDKNMATKLTFEANSPVL